MNQVKVKAIKATGGAVWGSVQEAEKKFLWLWAKWLIKSRDAAITAT